MTKEVNMPDKMYLENSRVRAWRVTEVNPLLDRMVQQGISEKKMTFEKSPFRHEPFCQARTSLKVHFLEVLLNKHI